MPRRLGTGPRCYLAWIDFELEDWIVNRPQHQPPLGDGDDEAPE
jgi:hypothetical protein